MLSNLARIPHPSVKNPPWLLRSQLWFVIKTSSQHFLAECDNVRSFWEVKPLMAPHSKLYKMSNNTFFLSSNLLSSWSTTSLNFINKIDDVVFLANLLQTLKPFVRSMMIASFSLDGLHNNSGDGTSGLVTVGNNILGHC